MSEISREKGKRVKTWGMTGDIRSQHEASFEYPVMYHWLGTPPQKEHPFNLYGDIKSQPQALKETIDSILPSVKSIAQEIVDRGINRIVGTGLGTSQFVAQASAGAFWKYAGIDAGDIDGLEYFLNPRPYDYSKICFAVLSGSGSTVDSNRAGRLAKEKGAFTLAVTSIDGSPVTQFCDRKIICAGGFDTGGSDTFHYTTRTLAMIMLAIEIGRIRQPGAYDYDALMAEIKNLPKKFSDMFDYVDQRSRSIATQYGKVRSAIVVGNGANYGAAEEMALKFDEMAHLPTKAMVIDRHIHGALGMTDTNIVTFLMAPKNDSGYKELKDIAEYCNTVKTICIGIVSEDDNDISNMVDDVIRLPQSIPELFPLLAILPSQLVPYWCSVLTGVLNPDTQRSNVPRYGRAWAKLFPPGTH
jgi:glucosamine--fructose-6-phosphate aminotransferase (isomerizing)